MRGYAHILQTEVIYNQLSEVMHGYTGKSVNASDIYYTLFKYRITENDGSPIIVSVDDILSNSCTNGEEIIDKKQLPLLAETLKQTLIYYHLRMRVEKELVDDYKISTSQGMKLGDIIFAAFKDTSDKTNVKYRVAFASKKTLLNEFNHFEGNMNIFQPAIDIEPNALKREIEEINKDLTDIRNYLKNQHP